MKTDLDTIDFSKFDKSGMMKQIKSFSKDFKDAWQQTGSIELPSEYSNVKNIVLLGMGGSGAANELIKELSFKTSCPVECVHDYTLPGYVGQSTLVIASSYSGNTEEPIFCFQKAKEKNAKLFAITTGGELKEMAKGYGAPTFIFEYPSQPRMATPYLLSPLIRIFTQLGFYKLPGDFNSICDQVEGQIASFLPETDTANNPAKSLAINLFEKLPIIYSSAEVRGIAMRFKNQINENAKKTAAYDYFPELNHNTIEGYPFTDCKLAIVMIISKFSHQKVNLREKITSEILSEAKIENYKIDFPDCTDTLAEHLVMMSFSDAVSYYLTILNRTDPTSIPNINYLKSKL